METKIKRIEKRKEEVILASIEIFKKHGIENSKMTDIADQADIGVASIYRYFSTKPELVIEAAIKIWEDVIDTFYKDFSTESYKSLNGIKSVETLLEVFLKLYKHHKDFMRFIEEFDHYITKEKISPDKLELYESAILNLKPLMLDALQKGKQDGSIIQHVDNHIFYMSITHTLLSLCQKLISRNTILNSDQDVEGEVQIKLIIEMAIQYLSK